MCGRYGLIPKEDFYDRFEISDRKIKVGVSYNITPGALVPVVTMDSLKQIKLMRWGLVPEWATDPKIVFSTINARGEEIENKPTFRNAFKSRRCLVPASGFYEWKQVKDEGKIIRIPYWIKLKDDAMFGFAGVFENDTFSIVTTRANELMAGIHIRMPVIVSKKDENVWLDNNHYYLNELKKIMQPYDSENMTAVRVSPRVNNPKENDEELIFPL